MAESKGFWGAVQEIATFPLILLLAGAAAAIWGASNGFHYNKMDLAAGDAWRLYVMIGGAVAVIGAIALYVTEKREDRPKPPLLYQIRGKQPYTILRPENKDTIEVKGKGQKFEIIITGKRAPRNSTLRIMWSGGGKLYPVSDTGSEDSDAPDYALRFTGYCPSPDKLRESPDERQFALYYVGKHAESLVQHHESLCRYFAEEGVPRWPELPKRVDIVRCSSLRTITFKLPQVVPQPAITGYYSDGRRGGDGDRVPVGGGNDPWTGNPNPATSGRGGLGGTPLPGTGNPNPIHAGTPMPARSNKRPGT